MENANLREGAWLSSHMGSTSFCHSTLGAAQILLQVALGLWSTQEEHLLVVRSWVGERQHKRTREHWQDCLGQPGPHSSVVGGSGGDGRFLPPLLFYICSQCLSPAWHIPGSASLLPLYLPPKSRLGPFSPSREKSLEKP